jgi:hypothetical protein
LRGDGCKLFDDKSTGLLFVLGVLMTLAEVLRGDGCKLFDAKSTGLLFVLGVLMTLVEVTFLSSSSISLSSLEACSSPISASRSQSILLLDLWNAALLGSLRDSGFLRSIDWLPSCKKGSSSCPSPSNGKPKLPCDLCGELPL